MIDAPAAQRRAQRQERQARVGILRNPNRAPNPPSHRPPLMGKWLPLRSSRRPSQGAAPPPEAEVEDDSPPVLAGDNGEIQGIDLARLMDSIEGLGRKPPGRAGVADHILRAKPPAAPPPPRPSEDARLAEAMRAPPPAEADEPPPLAPGLLRGALSRLFGAGT